MDENILYGGDYKLNFPFKSFGAFILNSLKNGGEKPALVNGQTKISWTYSNIFDEVLKATKVLHLAGIKENDVIAIISENRNEIAAVVFGAMCSNVISAMISVNYTKSELKHALEITKPKMIFTSLNSIQKISELLPELSFIENIVSFDGLDEKLKINQKYTEYQNLISRIRVINFDPVKYINQLSSNIFTQTATIFLSSGTTGRSKGCELTQSNFLYSLGQYANIATSCPNLPDQVVTLNIAPWFHVFGFQSVITLIFTNKLTNVYLTGFKPELFMETLQNYKVSLLSVPPPIVVILAKHSMVEKYDLSNLKVLMSGAAPLSEETEKQIIKRLKVEVFQGYGMTEGLLISFNHKLEKPISGSVGKILPGNYAKIIDENGKALGPNQVGELCFKGQLIFKGYLNDIKATAATIKNGWMHTGDLGYYDKNQNLFIVDRLKELIKFKGFQVPPAELEGLLLSNPKIKDCGVIGIADETAGELPFAFVVKQPNVELSEEEVKNFVKENASNAKWLRGGVKFIEEIPKNPSGKILRRELRELHKSMKAKL